MVNLRGRLLSPWRSPPDTIGALLASRYRIIHKVADGATGAVYCADDIGTRERVAIKLLRPELSEEIDLVEVIQARIRRNIELAKSDPGALAEFVDVIDIGKTASGLVYLVMPYVVGDDLQSLLRRSGPLPWSQAVGLFSRLCSALADYHRRGRVHGFLQSRKCILGHGGRVMFLDDGVDAFLVGTATPEMARYMSPEQASAEEVGVAADIYSLAVIFYELLTARVPFEDSSPQRTLAMHMLSPVPPLCEVAPNAGIPVAADAAILRALAKCPADRWASMGEFSAGLGILRARSAVAEDPSRVAPVASETPAARAQIEVPVATEKPAARAQAANSVAQLSPLSSRLPSPPSSASLGLRLASAVNEPTLIGLVLPSLVASSVPGETSSSSVAAAVAASLGVPAVVAGDPRQSPLNGPASASPVGPGGGQSPSASGLRRSYGGAHASASGRRIIDLLPGDSSMHGRIDDNLHPSASSSMRSSAGASGSRRIVNLVDVRAPGESTSEGWTPAAESGASAQVAGVAATRSRGSNASQGAAPLAYAPEASLYDSTDDLPGGDAAGGTTIEAAMVGDETLDGGSFRPGPSRAAITWALGGVGALLAGSVALALMSPPDPPKRGPAHEVAIVAPALEGGALESVAPEPDPSAQASASGAPEPGQAASVEGSEPRASTGPKNSKSSKRSKKRSKNSKNSKNSKRSKGSKRSKKTRRAEMSKEPASIRNEVEDDVLSQVQHYMREKKAREQRTRDGERSEAQRSQEKANTAPSPADQARASERLTKARNAYKSGHFSAAYSLASQSLVAHRSADALELMALASCARRDGDRARQLLGKITGARRTTVDARCREAGITL